jgi:hypothetical protein
MKEDFELLSRLLLWDFKTCDNETFTMVYRNCIEVICENNGSKIKNIRLSSDSSRVYKLLLDMLPSWFEFNSLADVNSVLEFYFYIIENIDRIQAKHQIRISNETTLYQGRSVPSLVFSFQETKIHIIGWNIKIC